MKRTTSIHTAILEFEVPEGVSISVERPYDGPDKLKVYVQSKESAYEATSKLREFADAVCAEVWSP